VRLFNSECAGASHTLWLAASVSESTAANSHTPQYRHLAVYFSQAILWEMMAA